MSSENTKAKESQLEEKPVEDELAPEQLNDVVGGVSDNYLTFGSSTNKSKTPEVGSFSSGVSNPNT